VGTAETASTQESLITPEALAMIGTEQSRSSGIVEKKQFQRWAAAVKDRNPLYFDAGAARGSGYRDVIAPPLYVQYVTLGVADLDELRPDGIPGGGGSGDIPLPACPRRMAGGESWQFHAPLYDGDVITCTRTMADIQEKHGRSGRFVLVTSLSSYKNQDGVVVAEARSQMIARP
jgi:hydroxyacyl-ACP dehydratase HTD2-like protein with hotdog domain